MFAEMLCVLEPQHRDRYIEKLRSSKYPQTIIVVAA